MSAIRISAATIAAAVALTGTTVAITYAPDFVSTATAESNDFNPAHAVKINPAEDGAQYDTELKSYQLISKVRHSYHSAGYDQKYDNYPPSPAVANAADLSEWACYIAKARVAFVILKMEGNTDARAIDVSKIGIDKATTQQALPILEAATKNAFREAVSDAHTGEDKKLYQNRHKLFNDGFSRLKTVADEFKTGAPSGYEYDAFSVTNWGIAPKYLNKTQADMHLTEEDLKVNVINAAQSQTLTPEQAEENGNTNRAIAATRFGVLPTPDQPSTTSSAAPATSSATTAPTSATSEPEATTSSAAPATSSATTAPTSATSEPEATTSSSAAPATSSATSAATEPEKTTSSAAPATSSATSAATEPEKTTSSAAPATSSATATSEPEATTSSAAPATSSATATSEPEATTSSAAPATTSPKKPGSSSNGSSDRLGVFALISKVFGWFGGLFHQIFKGLTSS